MRAKLVGGTKSSAVRSGIGMVLCAAMILIIAMLSTSTVFGAQSTDTTQVAQGSAAASQATLTRYQETDANLLYSGLWRTSYSKSNSGGTQKYTFRSGTSITIAFSGSSLTWIATVGPTCGIARVVLDGGTPVLVDLYASKRLHQQKVYGTDVLEDGPHILEIQWTGQKNAKSQNTYVYIDALDVAGSLTKASSTIAAAASQTTTTVTPTTTTTLAPTTTTATAPPATTTTIAATTTTTVAPTTTTIAPTTTTAPTQTTGKTYYLDATNGSDANNGTSTATPWKTLDQVRARTYGAGDQILLKRGEVWQNQRLILGSGQATGTAGSPVTVGAYGSGAKPIITGSIDASDPDDWTETSPGSHVWKLLATSKDIGFVVMNTNSGTQVAGHKYYHPTDTRPAARPDVNFPTGSQGDYYHNTTGVNYYGSTSPYIYMYSTSNPASYYDGIELSQTDMQSMIQGNSHITVQDIDFRYSSGDSILVLGGNSYLLPTR